LGGYLKLRGQPPAPNRPQKAQPWPEYHRDRILSIWTDAGTLLASQAYADPQGAWTETPLAAPLNLSAGNTYRVGFYTSLAAGGPYYYSASRPSTFANGTLVNGYYYSFSDSFPANFYSGNTFIMLVDLRYTVGSVIPVTPTDTGNFANGIWNGSITVLQPGTNVVLSADDGLGHVGQSAAFDVWSVPVGPVTVTVHPLGNQMQLSWPAGILQSASDVAGPYTDLPGATSPYTVIPSAPEQFFRVRVK